MQCFNIEIPYQCDCIENSIFSPVDYGKIILQNNQ